MRGGRSWKIAAAGTVLASVGAASLVIFGASAVSSASPRDKGGAPAQGAPGVGLPAEGAPGRPGSATLTLTSSTSTPSTSTTIDLSSFDFTQSNTLDVGSQSSGAGAGKVTFSPLVVTTPLAAQTAAVIADLSGHPVAAELVVRGPNGSVTLDATFALVSLKQYEISSASGVTLTLQYGALELAPAGTSTSTP